MAQRKSARRERRASERAAGKLLRQREKLARLESGGAPERPIDVESASLVEPRAEARTCLVCDGPVRTLEHRAEIVAGRRLRILVVRCARCGKKRVYYFRLHAGEPS